MEKDDKGSTLIRIGVSGWKFLLVPAYPGCPGSKAVKRSLLLLLFDVFSFICDRLPKTTHLFEFSWKQRIFRKPPRIRLLLYIQTHPFNGPFSGTTQVSRYQKGKTNLDFTEARDSEWQWHAICKFAPFSRQTTTPAPHHSVFYRPDALPAAQPTASKE